MIDFEKLQKKVKGIRPVHTTGAPIYDAFDAEFSIVEDSVAMAKQMALIKYYG